MTKPLPPLDPKPCLVCGTVFQPRRGYDKYCTDECAAEGKKETARAWHDRRKPFMPPCRICQQRPSVPGRSGCCSGDCQREYWRRKKTHPKDATGCPWAAGVIGGTAAGADPRLGF